MNRCESARRWMDARLDGEIGAGDAIDLQAHLDQCASCREIASSLEGVIHGLRHLPLESMSEEDVGSVLRRTVGARDGRVAPELILVSRDSGARGRRSLEQRIATRRWRIRSPYVLAAAAVLAAIAIVPFAYRESAPPEPTTAEVEAAAQEARMVLALASRAVRSAESTARKRVIEGEVAPALKHVPVRWNHDPASRRNGV